MAGELKRDKLRDTKGQLASTLFSELISKKSLFSF